MLKLLNGKAGQTDIMYRVILKDMWYIAVAYGHNHAKWLIEQEQSRLTDLERNTTEKEETT